MHGGVGGTSSSCNDRSGSAHSVGGSIGGGGSGGCCGVGMHGMCMQVPTWCVTNQVWRSEDNLSEPVIFHHHVGLKVISWAVSGLPSGISCCPLKYFYLLIFHMFSCVFSSLFNSSN